METITENDGALVKVREAAAMLAVSPRTVWRMIAEGQLRAVRLRGCTLLVLAEVSRLSKGGCEAVHV